MERNYGELMSVLLHNRYRFRSDAEFKSYLLESARQLASDLGDFGIETSVMPEASRKPARGGDWNSLKIGCE
jgi:hypothetical protein